MAQKPRIWKDRVVSLCAWLFMLLLGVFDILRRHDARFLSLLMIATALMMILHEAKGLLEEPN